MSLKTTQHSGLGPRSSQRFFSELCRMSSIETIIKTNLPVMESFYTIQGEGFHQGKAAYFIRLGGCDVGCVWCDVKESWDASKHPLRTIDEITDEIQINCSSIHLPEGGIVVITGGEPLLHNLNELTGQLKSKGYQLHLETSGSSPISGSWDWICLSPKKFKLPLPEIIPLAHELKIVIYNKSDFEWAEKFARRVNRDCKLYLQPEWDQSGKMSPLMIEYIKSNPKWEFSLQLHKYIDVP